MQTKTKIIATVLTAGVAIAATAGTAIASSSDDNEQPITGAALERASAVALDHLGEGSVTETEVGDEDSYYEVEVRLDDGREVDVQLDEEFNVVSDEVDTPDAGDQD
ncbi:MAG: PepSY domain-containing protein [Acidimicrobiales bacterium]